MPNSRNESHYEGTRKKRRSSKNENNNEKLNKPIHMKVMKLQLTKLKMKEQIFVTWQHV